MGWEFGFVLRFGGIWAGTGFGLIFGFVMAIYMRSITIHIEYDHQTNFLTRINLILDNLGYHPDFEDDAIHVYKPSMRAGILSGKISIQMNAGSAAISGPSAYLRKIQSRL